MYIATRNSSPNGFRALCWITGSPISVDADPNSIGGGGAGSLAALQTAGRVITTPEGIVMTSSMTLVFAAYDGASTCIVRAWWFDDAMLLWVPNGATSTLTTATSNASVSTIGCMPGAKFYLQVTANAGNVTKLAFFIR